VPEIRNAKSVIMKTPPVALGVAEALTNALKHAPGAPVTVDIEATDSGLTVTVENGPAVGAGSGIPRGGTGLAGMLERVLAHGGQFEAGPTATGGWRVHAAMPGPSGTIMLAGS
jgi:signal transduction histidine kinase